MKKQLTAEVTVILKWDRPDRQATTKNDHSELQLCKVLILSMRQQIIHFSKEKMKSVWTPLKTGWIISREHLTFLYNWKDILGV